METVFLFFNLTCSDTLQKIKMCFRIGVGIIEHVNRPSQTASKDGALLTISDGSGFNPIGYGLCLTWESIKGPVAPILEVSRNRLMGEVVILLSFP